jgi:nucleoside phosphorylase
MSSSRFEAFSERGRAMVGDDAARVVHDYLLARGRGARIDPRRIEAATGVEDDELDELIELACDPSVGLLEERTQVRHDRCGARVDLAAVLQTLEQDGEARCPSCEQRFEDIADAPRQSRLALTAEAEAEAAAARAAQDAQPRMNAVILTALPEELAGVRDQLVRATGAAPERVTMPNGGIYLATEFAGRHVRWSVYATYTQATTQQAAAGAVDAIFNFSPAVMLYVGIAGGIADKGVKLGDVVAATEVLDYDGGKETTRGLVSRMDKQRSSFALNNLAAFTAMDQGWRARIVPVDSAAGLDTPTAHTEPIAAGSKVVASTESETYKLVRGGADRALAVEMEGSGFLGAAQRFRDVDAIVVRGISDLIDGKALADRDGVRHQAVANAAAFAVEMLAEFDPGSLA